MRETQPIGIATNMRVAGVDLGSNMFRCVIADFDKSMRIHVLEKKAEVVAVAEGLWESNEISESALLRATDSIDRIRDTINCYDVCRVRAVATGAFRRATNRQAAIDRLSARLCAPIEVIHSEHEARLASLGVQSGGEENATFGVLDVGGVSTEFIVVDGSARRARSIDIGVITLTERGNHDHRDPSARQRFFERTAFDELAEFETIRAPAGLRVHAVGGAAVAVIAHRDGVPYCSFVGGESVLRRSELERLFHDFQSADPTERAERIGISRAHGNLIPAGFAILDAAMRRLNVETVIPSGRGVSEGLALETLLELMR